MKKIERIILIIQFAGSIIMEVLCVINAIVWTTNAYYNVRPEIVFVGWLIVAVTGLLVRLSWNELSEFMKK